MWRDVLFLGALILYVLAGCRLVPLHGDEATILYMSADFSTLFLHGDLAHIEYRLPPPADDPEAATKQALRIVNGVTSKYVYGAMAWLTGFQNSDLPQQWLWGADYAYNQSQKAVPDAVLLFVCRWASALLTALSVVLIFVTGRRAGGAWTGYMATFIYALTPAVLLNGRRAVFESTLLLFSALLVYLMLRWLNRALRPWQMVALGVVGGLTVASKHTGVISVAIVFVALIGGPLLARRWWLSVRTLAGLLGAGVISVVVFFALNASWWGTPLAMPDAVLQLRQLLLKGQIDSFGGFNSSTERVFVLIGQPLLAAPQYFEVTTGWPDWIGGQIRQYEDARLAGLYGARWTFIAGALVLIGVGRVLLRLIITLRRDPLAAGPEAALLLWLTATAITLYVLTPLDWQRYYVPLVAPMAVFAGLALRAVPYRISTAMQSR